MQKAKLFFCRDGATDDIIQFFDDDVYTQMVRIVYTPQEHTEKSNEFYLTRSATLLYVSQILKSMEHDNDPFEFVQLQTALHPSVIYPVEDLSEPSVRHLIEDMLEQALSAEVAEVKLKRTVRSPTYRS
jgi:hypothetical protein